ncbi:MAG: hypothetical protein M3395_01260 [Chloroflexota bacterium]|nr:hypothetical protein [Chloroflexota bacterium]
MPTRLHLKYGLVAEQDRLSSSADTLSVTEPATGSKSRTKGNLYLIVSSATMGGRARDATVVVADTIRREYYYDESAGIPICLEKAFRSAERKLRNSRQGQGIAVGSIGVALAIIRGHELYVATTGPAEAYLVRAARLLMPEHSSGPGLPTGEGLRLDVWRGEFAIGDSLLLVSRDLTEVVGTEELKNSVVTLHPQSAVEHLHHLFVAAGGEGSDAVLAIEASETATPRAENRLVPVASADDGSGGQVALAGAGGGSLISARAMGARDAMGNALGGLTARLGDLIPGRRRQYRRIAPRVSQRESQRRAAVAFLGFLGVILVLGLLVFIAPRGTETPIARVNAGDAALLSAQQLTDQVTDDGLITDDPPRALTLLQDAWEDLARAEETGVPLSDVGPIRERVAAGLDELYGTNHMAATLVARISGGGVQDPQDLVLGPDGAAYVLDQQARTVSRVDPETGATTVIVTAGDGSGEGIGTPMMLSVGGPDLLISDIRSNLWRWRPSDDTGRGTLGSVAVSDDVAWGDDIIDINTFLLPNQAEDGLYRLYVTDPSSNQILSYQPTADGSGFSTPSDYLAADNEDLDEFRQMLIDGNLYGLTEDDVVKHLSGRVQDFSLGVPPDGGDLRPGRDYRLFAGPGGIGEGSLYVWDAEHGRLLVFRKSDGGFVEQWFTGARMPLLEDLRGLYVVQPAAPTVPEGEDPLPAEPATAYWLTADALYRSPLVDLPQGPAASPSPRASPSGSVRPAASGEEPSPDRSRRPRDSASPAP